jgi:hypothetical protein
MKRQKSLEQEFFEENNTELKVELKRMADAGLTKTEASRILKRSFVIIQKYAKRYGIIFKLHFEKNLVNKVIENESGVAN